MSSRKAPLYRLIALTRHHFTPIPKADAAASAMTHKPQKQEDRS